MLDLFTLVIYCIGVLLLMFLVFCVVLLLISSPFPVIYRYEDEKYFKDAGSSRKFKFPSLDDLWSVHLSVVVPAYNEEVRLPPMLDECLEYLQKKQSERKDFKYEIIIVSDGSTDRTAEVAQEYVKKCGSEKLRVLKLCKNRGKGGAVRLGIQNARGAVILFADADGATKFSDLAKLETSLKGLTECDYLIEPDVISQKLAIVCGSRAHLEAEAIASRSIYRTILMYGFHFLVWLFAVKDVRDTQCGFKLLTREAARICFSGLHVERWAFDVELLYIAEQCKIPISEIAVNWTEIEGSKIVPVWSWVQMGIDLFLIWLRYLIGAWKLRKKHTM